MKKTSELIFVVTGAAGHLGRCVVKELLDRGHEVRGLVLAHESCVDFIGANDRYSEYKGDVCKPETLIPLFRREAEEEFIMIHCAGIVAITDREDPLVYAVNVDGTKNVITISEKYGIRRLVYVSSVHAIPTLKNPQITTEISDFDPDNVPGYYDKTKALATQEVLEASKRGFDAVVVHPSGIIGPYGQPQGNMAQLLSLCAFGKLPIAIRGVFDFVDVRDVATGIADAALKGKKGECYLLSNRPVELEELFELIAKYNGGKRVSFYLPIGLVKLIAPLCELYYRLLHKTPIFTHYSLVTIEESGTYSHEKAGREWGYKPRELDETIKDTVVWLKENKR